MHKCKINILHFCFLLCTSFSANSQFQNYDNWTLSAFRKGLNYFGADEKCSGNNGQLAILKNRKSNETLIQLIGKVKSNYRE